MANWLTQSLAQLFEELSILRHFDTLERCSENLHLTLLEHTLLSELHRQVQTCLTSQTGDNGIGTLEADNLRYILQCQWLHIYLIGNMGIGHNRCWVRVDQDNLITLLFEGETRLSSRVVKLCCLTYDDWS